MFLRKYTPSMPQLLAFEAAARHGSFTKAAAELHLTQGAVSRHVQGLEAMLQAQFFERAGRQVKLTKEGERYANEIAGALNRIRSASMQAYGARGRSNALQLAVIPIFGSKWLMQRLGRFYDMHPDLQIDIHSRTGELDLALAGMDAYINIGDGHWPHLVKHHLLDARATVIASPSLLKKKAINNAADLLKHRLLHVTTHSPSWKECLLASGIDPSNVKLGAQYEYTAHLIQAVVAGLGVGLVSDIFVRDECQQGTLAMVDIPEFAVRYKSYYLMYPPDRKNHSAVRLFTDWLLEEAAVTK